MTRLSKSAHVSTMYCFIFSQEGRCGFRNTTSSEQSVLPDRWDPRCVTSPESPLGMSPSSKGFDKNCDDAFLAGHGCALSSCFCYKIYSYIEYVTRKQMGSLTFKANQPHSDELYIWFSIDPLCPHCPSRNSPNIMCGQGHFVSLIRQGLLNCLQQNSTIDSTSCGHQTPVESRREAANWPIRLTLWQCTISKASSGWFVKTELDFKQSWDKYYSVSSKALISAYEILQPFNGSLSSVPYKDSV